MKNSLAVVGDDSVVAEEEEKNRLVAVAAATNIPVAVDDDVKNILASVDDSVEAFFEMAKNNLAVVAKNTPNLNGVVVVAVENVVVVVDNADDSDYSDYSVVEYSVVDYWLDYSVVVEEYSVESSDAPAAYAVALADVVECERNTQMMQVSRWRRTS